MRLLLLADINSVHTKKWVKSLLEKGMTIHLFSLAELEGDFYEVFENFNYTTVGKSGQQKGGMLKKISYVKEKKILKKIEKEFEPDIVHAHYASSYGLLGSFLNFHPYLISIWGSDILQFPNKNFLNRQILKRNFRKADYLLSTSKLMADEVKKYSSKKAEVIPFGVDTGVFRPLNKSNENNIKVIGVVKALEEVYGIEYLIRAFALLKMEITYADFELWIVGEGSLKISLSELSQELGISEQVKFLGKIPNTDLPQTMANLDIIVIPSLSESFGVVAVEALACEKPVIASDVGGLPEIIINNETGLLAEPKNPEDISKKIKELINDSVLSKRLSLAGREFVLKKYEWSKNVDQMYDFYKKCLN